MGSILIFIISILSLVICSYLVKYYYIEGIVSEPPTLTNIIRTTSPLVTTEPPTLTNIIRTPPPLPPPELPTLTNIIRTTSPITTTMAPEFATNYLQPATGAPLSYASRNILETGPPSDQNMKYNAINYDVTYHTDSSNVSYESSIGAGGTWVMKDGKLQQIPYSDSSGNHLYYEPGAYRFGPSRYVPNYAESVYLSKLTKLSTTMPYSESSFSGKGFCEKYKNYPDKLEEMCRTMSTEECASTNCCALLGGVRCTYGDISGPKIKAVYSDQMIANKDLYYYQGKCYGNCN